MNTGPCILTQACWGGGGKQESMNTTLLDPLPRKVKKPIQNIVGKGENADHQHFLLFPQSFLPNQRKIALFEQ